jgi:hypothetical protein
MSLAVSGSQSVSFAPEQSDGRGLAADRHEEKYIG